MKTGGCIAAFRTGILRATIRRAIPVRVWMHFRFDRILRIGSAKAQAMGEFDEKSQAWLSVIRVVLEKCTVLNMITIGRISATLVSAFPVKSGLPHFAAQDIAFE